MKTIHHLITIGIHLGLILALMTGSAQAAAPRSELPDPGGRPGAQTISDFPPVSPSPQALALSSPGDEFWSDDFYASGANGPVYALLADGNDLFVGGSFSTIGPLLTNNIARWDGSTWSALGSGLTSSVYALAMDSHGNLYAACNSDDYWGVPSTINRWDGSTWTQLGGGIDGFVETLAMDHNNNLYAGGQFDNIGNVSVNHIARWDGSTWSALGGGVSGTVNDLVVDGDGMLYAGGTFYNSYGNNVARWDGNSWTPLGNEMEGVVRALTIDGNGVLYAGGGFYNIYGGTTESIVRWDGSSWIPLASEVNINIDELMVDASGNLYASGDFTTIGGVSANHIARWDGSAWSPLGGGIGVGYWYDLANTLVAGSHGEIYAGGNFKVVEGDTYAPNLARWDGAQWTAFPPGDHGSGSPVYALAVDHQNGYICAGGSYDTGNAGGSYEDGNVACWNGATLLRLGSGIDGNAYALATDGHGNLYAGGQFNTAGNVRVRTLARWDGSAWSALDKELYGWAFTLAVDGNGILYAGGWNFGGAMGANGIARWDGSAWSTLGSGMNSGVLALAVDGDGNLYAGGKFNAAGGVSAQNIARWDGSQWSALGSGLNDTVFALAVDSQGILYAGGWFTTAGGVSANRIARWDGSQWSPLGSGIDGDVRALTVDSSDNLFAGGSFATAGGVSAQNIARWDGSRWAPLGSGIEFNSSDYGLPVTALVTDGIGNLYVGGQFIAAGGKTANNIARWHIPASLSGHTWFDHNANGIQDSGEPDEYGTVVNLYDGLGTLIRTTTDNGSGYLFDYLSPDTYTLEFIPPTHTTFTLQDQGTDESLDSDVNPTTGRTVPISLADGQIITHWDAGFVPAPTPLTIQLTGSGSGLVSSNPPGLLCTTGSCSHDFPYGSTVSLSAVPDTGSAFAYWSGDYSSVATTISVRVGSYQVISAAFQPPIDHFELTALPDHLPANGIDTATLTVRATTDAGSGTPFAGRAVDLALDPALGELSAGNVTLDADGTATTTFTAGTTPGTGTITATVFENGLPRVVTTSLTLDPNPLTGQISVIHTEDTLTYTFTLTNDAAFAQTVSLSASLPTNTAFDSVVGGLFSVTGGDFGNGYVYADSVELAPGQSYTLSWVIHHLVSVGDFLTVAHAASSQARLRLTHFFRAEGLFLPLIMNNQPGSP